jgi:hypothetical protein
MEKIFYLFIVSNIILFSGCKKYFGDKTNLDFIDVPEFQNREVAYVPIQPVIQGFVDPYQIKAGFDELLYIVDRGASQIVSMDQAGRILARYTVPGVTAVTQDRRLNLLAIGTHDTIINNINFTLSCIYRIDQYNNGSYGLEQARITKKIIHPFYFKSTISLNDGETRFKSISANADHTYYVSRTGNNNNSQQIGGPDDAVLLFNSRDVYQTPIGVNTTGGFFRDYFKKPNSITSLCRPPQITASRSKDFLFTSLDPFGTFKVQFIEFIESEFGSEFRPRSLVIDDFSQANGFLSSPNKFSSPYSICVTGNGTNYIFITDNQKDSVYQFTITGLEGVRPPPGSIEKKFIKTSFGGRGIGLSQFNNPTSVEYLDKILYVVDNGNKRILRFKLTLDFD